MSSFLSKIALLELRLIILFTSKTSPSNINSVLQFKGIVKSGDKLKAILHTKDGQSLYKVGDQIGNGFLIKSISIQNNSVEISNNFKGYRLSFPGFNNEL